MAEKIAYPGVTFQTWWALRKRFKQAVPAKITPAYLHSVLNVSEKTARDNELPTLRKLGFVDAENNVTELAKRWRDDEQYAAVCAEIVKKAYPQELLDAVPDANDENAARRWFMNSGGVGQGAAARLAKSYQLLRSGDLSAEQSSNAKPKASGNGASERVPRVRNATAKGRAAIPARSEGLAAVPVENIARPGASIGPSLHIDIQIHIAADASSSQVEAIFASMAKHLYDRAAS